MGKRSVAEVVPKGAFYWVGIEQTAIAHQAMDIVLKRHGWAGEPWRLHSLTIEEAEKIAKEINKEAVLIGK